MSVKKIIEEIVKSKAKDWKLKAFFLFGSTAYDMDTVRSDIDIAVAFEENLDRSTKKTIRNHIIKTLSQATGREIDIVEIEDKANKPLLLYNAIINGIPVYIKSEEFYKELITKYTKEMENHYTNRIGERIKKCEKMLAEIEEWVKGLNTQKEES